MKDGRRAGGITSGPESKILEGGGWEESRVLEDGSVVRPVTPGYGGYGGDQVDYKVGAASKGIIQRDFQHHATVFKSAYAKNPFDNVTAEELDEYRRIIDAKSRMDGGNLNSEMYFWLDFVTKYDIFAYIATYSYNSFLEIQTPVPDSSTMENTTGDVISPPPLPSDDPVRGATGVLSPTSPTTDTEHTTGDCTNKTNISFFCMINNTFSFTLTITSFYENSRLITKYFEFIN